jgi:hypothetical protein
MILQLTLNALDSTQVLAFITDSSTIMNLLDKQEWPNVVLTNGQPLLNTVLVMDFQQDILAAVFEVDSWKRVQGKREGIYQPMISFVDQLLDAVAFPRGLWRNINRVATGSPHSQSCHLHIEAHTHTMDALLEMNTSQSAESQVIVESAYSSRFNRAQKHWGKNVDRAMQLNLVTA